MDQKESRINQVNLRATVNCIVMRMIGFSTVYATGAKFACL